MAGQAGGRHASRCLVKPEPFCVLGWRITGKTWNATSGQRTKFVLAGWLILPILMLFPPHSPADYAVPGGGWGQQTDALYWWALVASITYGTKKCLCWWRAQGIIIVKTRVIMTFLNIYTRTCFRAGGDATSWNNRHKLWCARQTEALRATYL